MNALRAGSMQVRRELWEHRALLVWTPFGVALVLLVVALLSMTAGSGEFAAMVQGEVPDLFGDNAAGAAEPAPAVLRVFMLVGLTASVPLFVAVMSVLVLFYSLDSLYAERRDRSILFWRSLPVSDLATVLAKAGVALLLVPVLIVAALALFQLGTVIAAALVAALSEGAPDAGAVLRASPLPSLWLVQLYGALAMTLWWAPLVGWLLLVSAWAPKAPAVWALLPPIGIGMIERIALETNRFFDLLLERFTGFARLAFEFDARRFLGAAPEHGGDLSLEAGPGAGPGGAGEVPAAAGADSGVFLTELITPGALLASAGLWAGLGVAALALALAVYVRRYRGER